MERKEGGRKKAQRVTPEELEEQKHWKGKQLMIN